MSHLLSVATTSSRFQLLTLNNTFTTQPPFLGFKAGPINRQSAKALGQVDNYMLFISNMKAT
ncbi:hypothetical protein JHK82_024928 [Glycine max]|nr:hypothetical protein JHK82_024928 [Glycine max]